MTSVSRNGNKPMLAVRSFYHVKPLKFVIMYLKNEITQKFRDDVSSLISEKQREKDVEIITPFSTLSDKFVSVFVRFENEKFEIHDNGWFFDGAYNTSFEEFNTQKLIDTADFFDVKCHNKKLFIHTLNDDLISLKVHSLSSCIQFLVNLVEIENMYDASLE